MESIIADLICAFPINAATELLKLVTRLPPAALPNINVLISAICAVRSVITALEAVSDVASSFPTFPSTALNLLISAYVIFAVSASSLLVLRLTISALTASSLSAVIV